jgi:gluconokinase
METRFFIIMGVSGCGKTSVGIELASRLNWTFYDGDDFLTPANIAKMAQGTPLNDADRAPWLASLHNLISTNSVEGSSGVLACSALKERYRRILLADNPNVKIVYLKGSYDLIWPRMAARAGHFMKPTMLQSQFDTLEEPTVALTVDASLPVDEIVAIIINTAR